MSSADAAYLALGGLWLLGALFDLVAVACWLAGAALPWRMPRWISHGLAPLLVGAGAIILVALAGEVVMRATYFALWILGAK